MSIALKSVSYTYAADTPYAVQALDDVSVTFNEGEFVGIIGKTGCGKSTLIQMIDGLLTPDSGTVLFNGDDIHYKKFDRRILRENIGVVFQFPDYQLFETTVERDVAFALKHSSLSRKEMQNRVAEALEAVGFDYDKVKDKSPLSFSGGEKRRIAIAGVLAAKPKYLILDEPVAGLDPMGREDFLKMLDRLNQNGTAIIMISHNTDALAEYTQRIILMCDGKIIRDGRAEDILTDYALLEKNEVHAGQICNISRMLREKSFDIPDNTVKYKQFIEEICKICGRDKI